MLPRRVDGGWQVYRVVVVLSWSVGVIYLRLLVLLVGSVVLRVEVVELW